MRTTASSLIRPLMLGLGGFPSSWPLQEHKRPLGFRGLLSATDPKRKFASVSSGRSTSKITGPAKPAPVRRFVGPIRKPCICLFLAIVCECLCIYCACRLTIDIFSCVADIWLDFLPMSLYAIGVTVPIHCDSSMPQCGRPRAYRPLIWV